MKGLILKEIYNLKNQWKSILFIAVIFSLSFGAIDSGTLAAMSTCLCMILLMNSLAQDEIDRWYAFALTMPMTALDIVLAKYIFALFLTVFGSVVGLTLAVVTRGLGMGGGLTEGFFGMLLPELLATCGVVLVLVALVIPLNLKFGMQKSRFLLMGFVAVPVLVGLAVTRFGMPVPGIMLYGSSVWILAAGAAVLILAVVLASFFISVRIMKKKEF